MNFFGQSHSLNHQSMCANLILLSQPTIIWPNRVVPDTDVLGSFWCWHTNWREHSNLCLGWWVCRFDGFFFSFFLSPSPFRSLSLVCSSLGSTLSGITQPRCMVPCSAACERRDASQTSSWAPCTPSPDRPRPPPPFSPPPASRPPPFTMSFHVQVMSVTPVNKDSLDVKNVFSF